MAKRLFVLPLLGWACLLVGCAGTPGAGPWMDLPEEPAQQTPDAELFFTLITDPATINQNRAYHAFLIWADGKDEAKNFGQRIVALEQRRLADPNWMHDPLKPLTRGRLASMICRKMTVGGSWALWAFGPNERSARRALAFNNIIVSGGDQDTMNGAEFVNILKRADDYASAESPPTSRPADE